MIIRIFLGGSKGVSDLIANWYLFKKALINSGDVWKLGYTP